MLLKFYYVMEFYYSMLQNSFTLPEFFYIILPDLCYVMEYSRTLLGIYYITGIL